MLYFNVAKGTGATLSLPQRTPNSYTTLGFCIWYVIVDTVPGYLINNSCIKGIKSFYYARKDSKNSRLKGMNEFLEAESEACRAEASLFPRSW